MNKISQEVIDQCIKSLEWLKWNIVGDETPSKNTFEYATQVYINNAIDIIKTQNEELNSKK